MTNQTDAAVGSDRLGVVMATYDRRNASNEIKQAIELAQKYIINE